MRLLVTLKGQRRALQLSALLREHAIDNRLELSLDNDWGSEEYGTVYCDIWIVDEDTLPKAQQVYEEWQQHESVCEESVIMTAPKGHESTATGGKPMGYVTFYLLAICIALFVIAELTKPTLTPPLPNVPITPLVTAEVNKHLFYDYPYTFEIVDGLVEKYGLDALRNPTSLPQAGQKLFIEVHKTPWWQGLYPLIVDSARGRDIDWGKTGTLVEKIRQGQLWRLFTPVLLHGDFFHLLFNMLWLIALGKQLEQRLGAFRYLAIVAIVALISNAAQYLVSGPNFIGFSGVLCGMLAFIWQRQRTTPWEGYQLEPATSRLLFLFIGAMAALQLFFFIATVAFNSEFSAGLANTAHLVGAAAGYSLARLRTFDLHF